MTHHTFLVLRSLFLVLRSSFFVLRSSFFVLRSSGPATQLTGRFCNAAHINKQRPMVFHRPLSLFPGTEASFDSPRCSVLSSIVKHRFLAIDPVITSFRLYAAPTQEEGRSNIPANSRPTTEL